MANSLDGLLSNLEVKDLEKGLANNKYSDMGLIANSALASTYVPQIMGILADVPVEYVPITLTALTAAVVTAVYGAHLVTDLL